jgi:ankyrin repeat protein
LERRNLNHLHEIALGLKPAPKNLTQEVFNFASRVNVPDFWGRTPLSWAARRGDVSMVESLIIGNADPEIGDIEDFMPLHYASLASDPACLKALLVARANVHKKSGMSETALHLISFHQNDRVCVDLLMAAGADINARGYQGQTPLMTAVFDRSDHVVAALLDYGADIERQDVNGWTAVHFAVSRSVPIILAMLLERGASCAAKTRDHRTVLHIAASSTHVDTDMVAVLSRLPLDDVAIRAKDQGGDTAMDLVAKRTDISSELRKAYEGWFDRLAGPAGGDEWPSKELSEMEIFSDAVEYLEIT